MCHSGLPGAIAPVGEFDPAGFSRDVDELEMNRLRECELTHGRVGMLAAAGFLVQENFHPLFSGDGGPAIQQIPALPVPLWFGMTLAIGIAESIRIQKGFANPYDGEIATMSDKLACMWAAESLGLNGMEMMFLIEQAAYGKKN